MRGKQRAAGAFSLAGWSHLDATIKHAAENCIKKIKEGNYTRTGHNLVIRFQYIAIKLQQVCMSFCIHHSLCGHEESLDDAVQEASVPQVDQASLASLRLSNQPQRT